jgi:hypothetical protein
MESEADSRPWKWQKNLDASITEMNLTVQYSIASKIQMGWVVDGVLYYYSAGLITSAKKFDQLACSLHV